MSIGPLHATSSNPDVTAANAAVLGTDLKFPLTPTMGRLAMVTAEMNVQQAIRFWVEVVRGSILWNRTKGIGIEQYVHADLATVVGTVPNLIEEGLMLWEPRVKWVKVTATGHRDRRVVELFIEYEDIVHGIPTNMTYDLHLAKDVR